MPRHITISDSTSDLPEGSNLYFTNQRVNNVISSGVTITGGTNFTGGLTANTISATTYLNLPTDIRVTGGTYNSGTAVFTNNTGGTFSVSGFSTGGGFTGGTVTGPTDFTGGLTANTFSATTITSPFIQANLFKATEFFKGYLMPTYGYIGTGFEFGFPSSTSTYIGWDAGNMSFNVPGANQIVFSRYGLGQIVMSSNGFVINNNENTSIFQVRPQDTNAATAIWNKTLQLRTGFGFAYGTESTGITANLHIRGVGSTISDIGRDLTEAVIIDGISSSTTTYGLKIRNNVKNDLFTVRDDGAVSAVTLSSNTITLQNGVYLREGTNATLGVVTLTAGTATVNTTRVTANSRIFLTIQGGTLTNVGNPYVSARSVGTSFSITSTNGSDVSDVGWNIIEPV